MIGSRCQQQPWLILCCSTTTIAFLATVAHPHPAIAPAAHPQNLAESTPHPSDHSHPHHSHASIEVPATQPLPAVQLLVYPDAKKGWNLELKVTNFVFAPNRINQASTDLHEGHAHLYIDGKKVTRLYGHWYYLETLSPGEHQLRVTLNTNSHAELMHNGKPIEAIATIKVP